MEPSGTVGTGCNSGCCLPAEGQLQGQTAWRRRFEPSDAQDRIRSMTGAQPPVKLRAMPKTNISRPEQPPAATFLDRVRVATELLESIVVDRGLLLADRPADDRQRLLQAAGHVYAPDAVARRQLVRASSRRRKAEKIEQEDRVLNETGIRTLRRQTVFTTPNVFPPVRIRAARGRRSRVPRGDRAAALLRLQAEVHRHPPLLRPAVPALRRRSTSPSAPSWPTCAAGWRC